MRRRDVLLLAVACLAFLGSAAAIEWLSPSLVWVADLLAVTAIALAAFGGGWIGGVIALLIGSLAFMHHFDHLLGEGIEWVAVALVMIFVRQSVLQLRRSESKLRALVSSMDDVIFVLDEHGTYLEIAATNRRFRYRPEKQVVGARVHEVFPQEIADWFVANTRRVLTERQSVEVDYSLPIGEGTFWFSASIAPLSDSTVIWVVRDITARKLAEEAVQRANVELEQRVEERTRELRSSEERYRSVFDQAEEIIYTLSRDGLFTSLNPAFERVLGWPREEWIGKSIMALVPADCQQAAQKLFDDLLHDGSVPMWRQVLLGKQGQRVTVELTIVDQVIGGKSVGFLGVARDITEREVAEEKIRRSERQLVEAQRSAGLGSYEHDLIAGTMWWSEELCHILKVEATSSPLPFSALVDLVMEDDRPKLEEAHRFLLARGNHEWEMRVRLSDGAERIVWCTGTVVSNPAQGTLRVIGSLKDVTRRRLAEQRVLESEERFRLITLATSDAVWDADFRSGRLWLSEGFLQFGYKNEFVELGYDWWIQRVHPTDRERVAATLREAVESGQSSWSQEYQFCKADGSYAYVLDRGYVVRDDSKSATRLLGAMMDLTERKQLEEQLEQSKRVSSLGRVAASIAHEFNNVLMGIQPNVEIIQRSSPKGLRQITDNILHAVKRGKRITDEILNFTRPAEPNLQCLSVAELFGRWKTEVEPLLGGNVELQFETGSDVHVLADPLQLAQVFTNLALNARDAMQEQGGKLTVAAHLSKSFGSFPFGVVKSPDRFVHFSVTDKGRGIDRERLEHIFEPLFTTKKGGIGLGLAIAYQIVTRHDGHIFVESEPGIGSTVHVFIPATSPLVHESVPEIAPAHLPLHRVVLVEDEPSVASGMAMLLEMEGVTVEIASTGRESIPAIERVSPDAVVLDIGLPDMDGVGVYLEIERRWPTLPVLFSSGHGDSAKLDKYLARPNVGFILKPYDFDTMRAELNRLLDSGVARTA